MGTQAGFDPNAFGPFGAIFQTYLSAFETYSPTKSDAVGTASPFDPQALSAQVTAPLKAMARCQLEALGLVNRRAQAYMQVPTRVAHCRTPHDLLNEYMAFWHTAAEQYRESGLRIGEAWGQILPWAIPADAEKVERDYISFNGAGKESGGTHAPRSETGKQRRVA